MPFNLTMQGTPTYNGSGKFGSSLNGGNGYTTTPPFTAYPLTIRQWVKATSSGNIEVAGGRSGAAWVGKAANNTALAHFGAGSAGTGNGNDITMASTVNIADGAWHELELNVAANGTSYFFVDGALASSSTAVPTFPGTNNYFGARAFFGTAGSSTASFPWQGEVDQLAVFNTIQHTAAYTPATTALTGNEAGLVALYPFDGNGNDTAGAGAATALVLSAPATATVGTPITVTVSLNGTTTATTTANLTATDGTYNPAQVTVPISGSVTSQYTAASAGAKTLTATDNAAALTAATASTTASAAAAGFDQTKVLFSPGNWNVGTGTAKTIDDGAYFRVIGTGTTCQLTFDMSATSSPVPKVTYAFDGLPPVTTDLAATMNLTLPTETAALGVHQLSFLWTRPAKQTAAGQRRTRLSC